MNFSANGRLSGLVWSGLARHVGTVSQRVRLMSSYGAQISPISSLPSAVSSPPAPTSRSGYSVSLVARRHRTQFVAMELCNTPAEISSSLCDGHLR